jgi:antitoxin HicB
VKQRKHIGSSFDEWLAEEGILAEVDAATLKAMIRWQAERGMGEKKMSKSEMAREMRTSRAALDRLLDPKNESVTLAVVSPCTVTGLTFSLHAPSCCDEGD